MARSDASLVTKHAVGDLAGGILLFPVWWYGRGLSLASKSFGRTILNANKFLGVSVWARNLLVPMYGERSVSGRIISFFMRLANVVFRGVVFVVLVLVAVLALAAYVLVLPFALYGVIYHGLGVAV